MRLTIAVDLDYAIIGPPTDVLLQIEAAATPDQRIVDERLTIWSDHPIAAVAGEDGVGQRCWIRAEQWLKAEYRATVDVERAPVDLAPLRATPVRELAGALVPICCPVAIASRTGWKASSVAASPGWRRGARRRARRLGAGGTGVSQQHQQRRNDRARYLRQPVGRVPRLCASARRIGAGGGDSGALRRRLCAGVDPPDFHAVAELWLDGAWRLVDATGMATADTIARVCAGRDATDIAFMTVFGTAQFVAQTVRVTQG